MKGQGCEASIDEFAQFFMDDEGITIILLNMKFVFLSYYLLNF